ncbi:MAG: alanine racemase [Bacteroidetes bacterium]|nr:alanine racemase [Bacteroidota bacterium]
MYSLKNIAKITGVSFEGKTDHYITTFLSDSRNLADPSGVLFIAIKTGKNNGHKFIPELIEKGVTSFLVQENEIEIADYFDKNVSFVVCPDPLGTLQILAAYHRAQFKIPVIGITGSNGKTIVKEWLYQLLKKEHTICRSPKSFNSQLGVPLSVLNLNATHTLGIFEAGISLEGEMEKLAEIIQPTLGIITSIGSAHDEGFTSRDKKLKEKFKLVDNCEKIIVNGLKLEQIPAGLKSKTTLVSERADADFRISFNKGNLQLENSSQELNFKIPFSDQASVLNVSTCAVTLMRLGYNKGIIAERLENLQALALRLEIKSAINNSLVINDYYNSDLDSLKIALNFLHQQNRRQFKSVIVSDIEQSGVPDNQLYREIATLVSANKIDLLVGIGKKISSFKTYFKADSLFFKSTDEFLKQFKTIDYRFSNSTILLKGARSFGFEEIGNLFQQKSHDTVFEINLNKLTDNVNYYRSLLQPATKLMCMVKAMGYGGGGSELAKTLQHIGVNYLAVAYADEGVELRQSQITLPIMVMSPETEAFEDIIKYRLEPEIYSFKSLQEFVLKLDHLGVSEPYPVHIKIDTGMHRLGFEEEHITELINILKKTPQVKVQSVFSHLAASDNEQLDEFTSTQIKIYDKVCLHIENETGYKFIKHICNSGAIRRFKQAHYDMVRLGIGMHGVGVNAEEQKMLQNVGTLRTKISQIKNVLAGETVGYNRNGKTTTDIRIATIPIGYADGFSRSLGNGNFGVYINGTYCKTIGNICMDMCMIDITNITCKEGDTVIIFETIDQLNAMAAAMGTITYEVLTSVSGRVKRIYVQE